MRYLPLLIIVMLSGCTMLDPHTIPNTVLECATPECVKDIINNEPIDEDLWGSSLMRPIECGPVDLNTIELTMSYKPWLYSLGAMGYAVTNWDEYGNMESCTVGYANYWGLAHELWHCRGYWERQPYIWLPNPDYTAKQKEIMEKEGVSTWKETSKCLSEN